MRIQELDFTEYRGIRRMHLDLDGARAVLLFGANGAGKSSVLDATSALLSWAAARIRSPHAKGRVLTDTDIIVGEINCAIVVEIDHDGHRYRWMLTRDKVGGRGRSLATLDDLNPFGEIVRHSLEHGPSTASTPVLVHYPVHRAVLDIPLRIKERHTFDQVSEYEAGRMAGANFRVFFEWFRQQEDIENELARAAWPLGPLSGAPYEDPQLSAVRRAIAALMPGYDRLRVQRKPRLRMLLDKDGVELEVSQLSDGEKCLLAMVGDLARRLALSNPGAEDPLSGEGIVLIDEVDLHLHPSWQRRVVPALMQTFPGCQFMLTTHSAVVLSEAHEVRVVLLSQRGGTIESSTIDRVYGRDANRILEDYMDTPERPRDEQERLRAYFAAIDAGDADQAAVLREELEMHLGADDPEMVRADVLLRRKQILGR